MPDLDLDAIAADVAVRSDGDARCINLLVAEVRRLRAIEDAVLRNHADALADLIDAAGKIDPLGEHRPFRSIPTQCADCLNTWPCPTENVRAALDALDGPS